MGRKGSHSEQFRLEACKLVSEQGYSIIEAAKQLDVPYNTLWNWLAAMGLVCPRARNRISRRPMTLGC